MSRVRIVAAFVIMFSMLGGFAYQSGAAQDLPRSPSVGDAAHPDGTLPGDPKLQLVKVADGFADPVNVASANDGTGRLFVVERIGRIQIIQDGKVLADPFLDIQNTVKTDFLEQGLLGLAFAPDYKTSGRFFIYYSDYQTNGALTLAEYHVSKDDPNKANTTADRLLFQIPDPYVNHNGGTIKFGPDGYLYIAIGDGGLAGDPLDQAQDLSKLFGKILRIDINSDQLPYGIPDDNPFATAGQPLLGSQFPEGNAGYYHPDGSPEVFVYGLRNPWQFAFDSKTGDLYIADVGQDVWEEVNVVPAGTSGQNFGWDRIEATHCYPAVETSCTQTGTLPVAEYDHSDANGCSITGIGVARGDQYADVDGVYFHSDYCSGVLYGLVQDADGNWIYAKVLDTDLAITGAGQGEDGTLYATSCECSYGKTYNPLDNPQGAVWAIVEESNVPSGAETAPLSAPNATPES